MLINVLDPSDLGSQELADAVSPSVDHKKFDHQMFQTKTDDIPNFPHAQTPVLPQRDDRRGRCARSSEWRLYLCRQSPSLLSSLSTRTIYFQ